jgi:outer membrane protein assembly factor BamB
MGLLVKLKPLKSAALIPIIICALAGPPQTLSGEAQVTGAQQGPQTREGAAASGAAMERGNPQRTGVYPAGATLPAGTFSWTSQKLFEMRRGSTLWGRSTTFKADGNSVTITGPDIFMAYEGVGYSDPIIADGLLFFSVFIGDGYVYALDARTGELKWGAKREKGSFSPPAVAGGTLYVGADKGLFYAVDLKSKEDKWQHLRMDGSFVFTSPAVSDGVVYYTTSNGNLFALDAETGAVKWTYATKTPYLSPPAVSDGVIYFAGREELYCVDGQSGKEKWRQQFKEGVRMPAVANGLVYFRDHAGHIRTVDARTGQPQPKPRADHQTPARIAVTGETIYFTGWDTGSLFAVDAATREIKWKFSLPADVRCAAPMTAAGRVYFTCSDGRLYAVDANTGKKLWTTGPKRSPLSAPVIADGLIYFINDDGKVYGVK